MRRLFLALWPDDATRRHVKKIAAGLHLSPRQRVKTQNIHVTLVFIGQVEDELLPAISQRMAAIEAHSFTVTFDELSYWRKPRILCLTCSNPDAAALRLAADITAPLVTLGVRVDTRPYVPHLTLARHVAGKPEIAFEPLHWHASGFALVESVRTPDGTVYQPLGTWPLQP
jgi:2'-5' RNA ligase